MVKRTTRKAVKTTTPGYLLPINSDPENLCVCVPVPNDPNHIRAFMGQILQLGYWYTWERDDEKSGRLAAAKWREIFDCVAQEMDCIMATGCGCGGKGEPTNRRINADGLQEVSYDNGETWEIDRSLDYRFNSPVFAGLPGADGADKRCQGANSIVEMFDGNLAEIHEQLLGAHNFETVLQAIAGYIALVTGGLGFVPALLVALGSLLIRFIVGLTASEFEDAFTNDVKNELLCVLYCNMSPNASFTETQWQAVKAAIVTEFDPIPRHYYGDMINMLGPVGLTNLARSNAGGSRLCTGCACASTCIDPANIILGNYISHDDFSITIEGVLVTHNDVLAYWVIYGSNDDSFCCLNCDVEHSAAITSGAWVDCEGVLQTTTSPVGEMVRRIEFYRVAGSSWEMTLTFAGEFGCPE